MQYAFVVPGIIALVAGIVVAVCYPDVAGDRKRSLQLLGFFRMPMAAAAFCMSVASEAISVVNTSFLTVFPTRFQKNGSVSSVAGIMDFATYLGAGISSVLYGLLLEQYTYDSMFASWLILAAVATIVLSLYERGERGVL